MTTNHPCYLSKPYNYFMFLDDSCVSFDVVSLIEEGEDDNNKYKLLIDRGQFFIKDMRLWFCSDIRIRLAIEDKLYHCELINLNMQGDFITVMVRTFKYNPTDRLNDVEVEYLRNHLGIKLNDPNNMIESRFDILDL